MAKKRKKVKSKSLQKKKALKLRRSKAKESKDKVKVIHGKVSKQPNKKKLRKRKGKSSKPKAVKKTTRSRKDARHKDKQDDIRKFSKPKKVTKSLKRKKVTKPKSSKPKKKKVRRKKSEVKASPVTLRGPRTEVLLKGKVPDTKAPSKVPSKVSESKAPTKESPVSFPHEIARNVYYIEKGSPSGFDESTSIDRERFMMSSNANSIHNRNFEGAFKEAFIEHLRHTPFEDADDVPLFRFGILIRPRRMMTVREVTDSIRKLGEALANILPKDYVAHIVDEGKVYSVRIGIGSNTDPTTYTEAKEEFMANQTLLNNIVDEIAGTAGDIIWFSFWDSEEMLYE